MNHIPKPRSHLVERAVAALGLKSNLSAVPQNLATLAEAATRSTDTVDASTTAHAAVPPAVEPSHVDSTPITAAMLERAGLCIGSPDHARSRLSEELTVLQQHLLRTLRTLEPAPGRAHRAILVTSTRPGEGKSFSALNLAVSMALAGTPTLLIDADGKPDSVSARLGIDATPGLRLLAAGAVPAPLSLIRSTVRPRLGVLPYGIPATDQLQVPPAALVAEAVVRLGALLPGHVLVIDSPPCLSTSDPSSLAAVVGQVLMVVQAERTQRGELEAALDLVEACPVLQLVLNRSRIGGTDHFGAYGDYGYGSPPASGASDASPLPSNG